MAAPSTCYLLPAPVAAGADNVLIIYSGQKYETISDNVNTVNLLATA